MPLEMQNMLSLGASRPKLVFSLRNEIGGGGCGQKSKENPIPQSKMSFFKNLRTDSNVPSFSFCIKTQ